MAYFQIPYSFEDDTFVVLEGPNIEYYLEGERVFQGDIGVWSEQYPAKFDTLQREGYVRAVGAHSL